MLRNNVWDPDIRSVQVAIQYKRPLVAGAGNTRFTIFDLTIGDLKL